MAENLRSPDDQPKEIPPNHTPESVNDSSQEKEQSQEQILDVLESAFEKKGRVEVTILEPSGALRTTPVIIEGFENGTLFVSTSEGSIVMGIPIGNVKKAK
jgi:hypothetical protein